VSVLSSGCISDTRWVFGRGRERTEARAGGDWGGRMTDYDDNIRGKCSTEISMPPKVTVQILTN